jgi:hypothetical protein
VASGQNSTIIFPLPLELMRPFMKPDRVTGDAVPLGKSQQKDIEAPKAVLLARSTAAAGKSLWPRHEILGSFALRCKPLGIWAFPRAAGALV